MFSHEGQGGLTAEHLTLSNIKADWMMEYVGVTWAGRSGGSLRGGQGRGCVTRVGSVRSVAAAARAAPAQLDVVRVRAHPGRTRRDLVSVFTA